MRACLVERRIRHETQLRRAGPREQRRHGGVCGAERERGRGVRSLRPRRHVKAHVLRRRVRAGREQENRHRGLVDCEQKEHGAADSRPDDGATNSCCSGHHDGAAVALLAVWSKIACRSGARVHTPRPVKQAPASGGCVAQGRWRPTTFTDVYHVIFERAADFPQSCFPLFQSTRGGQWGDAPAGLP